MKKTVIVKNLRKFYVTYTKQKGVLGAIKSFFKRERRIVKAVNNISFTLEEGELVGFIGQNGAGKTTTLKCLSGVLYPDKGEISVLGFHPFDRKKEFLKQIAFVMGRRTQLHWDLPPLDSYLLYKEVYEIDDNDFKKTLSELVDLLDFEKLLKQPVRNLSLGERMKAELIASLIHKPKVLFLDEPTIGLDVVMQKVVRDFIKEYNRKYRATILLTSHYMEDVETLCNRVIIIDQGRIYYDGDLNVLKKKYIKRKKIDLVIEGNIPKEEFVRLGYVKEYSLPRVVIEVEREKVPNVVKTVLSKYKVIDLSINEPDIADIVREVFLNKR